MSYADLDEGSTATRTPPPSVLEGISRSYAEALLGAGEKLKQHARQKLYYNDPALWAKEVLNFHAWSKQREIGDSLVSNSYTAVKSCHGAGKSAWAAVLVCWFVTTRLAAGEEVFVITTAPSYSQVHLVLWEEIRKRHAFANLPGYITNGDEWKIEVKGRAPIELAKGRKPSDTDANSFQGKHAYNLLIVLDEANGIPELLYTGATVMLTGEMSRQKMLAIGNPDDPNSQFGKNDAADKKRIKAGKKPFWNTIQIRADSTPNFTGEEVPPMVAKSVLSKQWVADRIEDWGTDDPRYISKILAEFPAVSEHSLFSHDLIDRATHFEPDPGYDNTSRIMGVDIARFGRDRTVVVLNVEGRVMVLDSWAKKDLLESANRIHSLALEHHVTQVRVDGIGVGGGVIDFLRAHCGWNYKVVEMNASAASPDAKRWVNARDFWFDDLREQMYQNRVQIPNEPKLHGELGQIQYTYKGALKVESKDEIKKRLKGASTDYADAVAFCTARIDSLLVGADGEAPPRPGDRTVVDLTMKQKFRAAARGYAVSPV